MHTELPDAERMLDVAAGIIAGGGYRTLTLESLAKAADVGTGDLIELFGSLDEALVIMLNREFTGIYLSLVDHVERDPRGGLLSRIYYYTLAGVYERPLAKALYTLDRDALNTIMRSANSYGYIPGVGIRAELIERMQSLGMARRDVDAGTVARMLATFAAGLALTAPHEDLDRIVRGVSDVLAQMVDTDVADTAPGKAAFYEWAMSLADTK